MRFARERRLEAVGGDHPETIVVLLHGRELSGDTVLSIAARWGAAAPYTAFIELGGIEELDSTSRGARPPKELEDIVAPPALDRVARRLEPLIRNLRLSN